MNKTEKENIKVKLWVVERHDGNVEAHCPTCGKYAHEAEYNGKLELPNYCPHCGEKLGHIGTFDELIAATVKMYPDLFDEPLE